MYIDPYTKIEDLTEAIYINIGTIDKEKMGDILLLFFKRELVIAEETKRAFKDFYIKSIEPKDKYEETVKNVGRITEIVEKLTEVIKGE